MVRYAWAAPVTLVGLAAAGLVRAGGGRVRLRGGIVEASGGMLERVLPRMGWGVVPVAMALGHVVLAVDDEVLDAVRDHEMAHVRQAERWGILFPLAYGVAAVAAVVRGGHGYRDNRFEVEARAAERRAQ
jgi:hypothetical protein